MGVQERRARERNELRRRILKAASDLFVNEGVGSVSMRRIAEKVEYSPAAIYLYFKDKGELLFSICQETFHELDKRLADLDRCDLSPIEGFKRGCETYVRFGLEHPSHYLVTLCTPEEPALGSVETAQSEEILALGMRAFDHLRRCVRRCLESGEFRAGDAEAIAQMCWLSIHGLTAGLITSSKFPNVDRETLIKLHIDTLSRGLSK